MGEIDLSKYRPLEPDEYNEEPDDFLCFGYDPNDGRAHLRRQGPATQFRHTQARQGRRARRADRTSRHAWPTDVRGVARAALPCAPT